MGPELRMHAYNSTEAHGREPLIHKYIHTHTYIHNMQVDTHVWDLNYACMRTTALKRMAENTLIEKTFVVNKLNQDAWAGLHEPLPLGFSSVIALDMGEGASDDEKLIK